RPGVPRRRRRPRPPARRRTRAQRGRPRRRQPRMEARLRAPRHRPRTPPGHLPRRTPPRRRPRADEHPGPRTALPQRNRGRAAPGALRGAHDLRRSQPPPGRHGQRARHPLRGRPRRPPPPRPTPPAPRPSRGRKPHHHPPAPPRRPRRPPRPGGLPRPPAHRAAVARPGGRGHRAPRPRQPRTRRSPDPPHPPRRIHRLDRPRPGSARRRTPPLVRRPRLTHPPIRAPRKDRTMHSTLIVGRMRPEDQDDVARLFAAFDATEMPHLMGTLRRELFTYRGLYFHLQNFATPDGAANIAKARSHPLFQQISNDLRPFIVLLARRPRASALG